MRLLRRVAVTIAGAALCIIGGLLLVLPGPGLLLIVAGLVLLSSEYLWARRLLEPARRQALRAAELSASSRRHIAGTATTGGALIVAGIVWAAAPDAVPFGGLWAGAGLIVSGAILLGLLVYTLRVYSDR